MDPTVGARHSSSSLINDDPRSDLIEKRFSRMWCDVDIDFVDEVTPCFKLNLICYLLLPWSAASMIAKLQ